MQHWEIMYYTTTTGAAVAAAQPSVDDGFQT